jgi:hypothetical protein
MSHANQGIVQKGFALASKVFRIGYLHDDDVVLPLPDSFKTFE